MSRLYGYAGKILRIDLTDGSIFTESTESYARKWLGQRGIGQRILYCELPRGVDPYEPDNIVVVETGPLSGTLAPGASRYSLASINPFSGGVGTSNSCGFFGPELKYAGYDHIVIRGKAKKPAYILINDDRVEIKDASRLWGKTTWETEDQIQEELGDNELKIISIGPAGENLVRGGCVISGKHRAAGKCGLGGIFGSKNLKAIAVRGTGAVKVAQPERFMAAIGKAWDQIRNSVALTERVGAFGTIGSTAAKNDYCSMPYKNFQDTSIPSDSIAALSYDIFMNKFKVRDLAGPACPVHCAKYYRIPDGPYAGLETGGIQLNTLADFGGKCAIDNPAALVKLHALCNQLGVDLDASSGAIAWAFECYQRGIISEADTGGLKLVWGDYRTVVELVRKICYREGFGDLLAEGSKRASEKLGRGSGYYAMHIKGQDLYESIRSPLGWGLGACVATRAGGHTTGVPGCELAMPDNPKLREDCKRVFGITDTDPLSYQDVPELVQYFEREHELINSLGLCMFVGTWLDPNSMGIPELAEIYSAATGWETDEDEAIRIADRLLNLEKVFNIIHAGFGRADDLPPERCLKEPIKSGQFAGFCLSEKKWNRMLSHYYEIHGWDRDTGVPTRECLASLDLEDVADDLARIE